MTRILFALGVLLIGWGGYVLVTGDFVATLDIAASLIASGAGVIALGGVVRSLDTIALGLAERGTASAAPVFPPSESDEPHDSSFQPGDLSSGPDLAVQPEPEPPAVDASFAEEPPTETPESPAPALVREGVIEGRHYRFYSDGSIEAEGPRGVRRYRSIEEAREQILRDREQPASAAPAVVVEAPETLSTPRHPVEPARRAAPPARAAKAADQVTWDSYLSAGSTAGDPSPPLESSELPPGTAEDDEWSAPFRVLLRGDGADLAPETSKPRKR